MTITRLRERQIVALKQLINLNAEVSKKQLAAEPQWKVLIFDRYGKEIIFSLLSIKEIRELGVTLTLLIHSEREAIEDVPAIYFCVPTEENVQRISSDCGNFMYEKLYLNFIGQVSRRMLEDLATRTVQTNSANMIAKVFDQYLNFISLESSLFTLRHSNRDIISYHTLNSSKTKDAEIEQSLQLMAESLFSVCVTLGTVPIIRAQKETAAEMLAQILDKKFREHLKDSRSNLFVQDSFQAGQMSFQRPLLILLDRNLDLATPLHHTWTYQALVHDTLELQLNKIRISESAGRPVKDHDLGPADKFWQEQKGNPFPTVAEAIQESLEAYKASEGEVTALKAQMGLDDEAGDIAAELVSDNTTLLANAVSSLPELLEKKRHLNLHMNMASAVLEEVKRRKLDQFFETEEKILSKGAASLDKPLNSFLQDGELEPEDKVRLFVIYLLTRQSGDEQTNGGKLSTAEIDSYCAELEASGCDIRPVNYIRKWMSINSMGNVMAVGRAGAKQSSLYTGGGNLGTAKMFSNLLSQGSQFVMEGVKNFVLTQRKLPVSRVVQNLMENKSGLNTEVDEYEYLDPKVAPRSSVGGEGGAAGDIPRTKNAFNEAIVFMVGGGNYIEYQNLVDLFNNGKSGKKVLYGCTELSNGRDFLKQLCLLGSD
ncbi:sec1 family domain-containing protein 1-like [Symsagittifera roscoffensis]|uniref:sec1 family domain-containing protein 1-like n=1 Tax=Symsagittifera roscoffensis TaxID=84072 RepID=UPI00307C9250